MAEADPIGTFDQAVEISFLNDVLPDVLRSDFKRAVISLGIRPQGRDFLERLGARKDVQGNDKFDCYGVVYCSEVDELLDSMRRQDRLTPQLEERVNRLRSHFGAMSSCFFEFNKSTNYF